MEMICRIAVTIPSVQIAVSANLVTPVIRNPARLVIPSTVDVIATPEVASARDVLMADVPVK